MPENFVIVTKNPGGKQNMDVIPFYYYYFTNICIYKGEEMGHACNKNLKRKQ